MKVSGWFRRPTPPEGDTGPSAASPEGPADERVREGADDLQATRQAIAETLTALSGQLETSRAQWDDQTRAAYQRMRDEWQASLQHMDATIERVRTGEAT